MQFSHHLGTTRHLAKWTPQINMRWAIVRMLLPNSSAHAWKAEFERLFAQSLCALAILSSKMPLLWLQFSCSRDNWHRCLEMGTPSGTELQGKTNCWGLFCRSQKHRIEKSFFWGRDTLINVPPDYSRHYRLCNTQFISKRLFLTSLLYRISFWKL